LEYSSALEDIVG